MQYCANCRKVTANVKQFEFTEDFSSRFQLVIVTCEICGIDKIRYLEEIDYGV